MDNRAYFSTLTEQLARRAARAVLSQLGVRSPALREYLRGRFEQMAGEEGSFVADPVFEATFGWEAADKTMSQLMGNLLEEDLVLAMDSPPESLAEQRFWMSWYPHRHQLQAWQVLNSEKTRSAVITSGTGSGKTECFLVPILNDLARERNRQQGRLRGVRALFLYPLNALINSQRERLKAWTAGFKGDIRYCLYNGETPAQVKATTQRETPQEVLSRDMLRSEPPSVLVTNATMLEYMLVRNVDRPILAASRGQLRWIVLDEAHTYIGSQAAELALLLRRVLHAFGVEPTQVRFVATSATIGGGTEDVTEKLRQFLADVAGVTPETVSVIKGRRRIPPLPEKLRHSDVPLPEDFSALETLTAQERFTRLAANLKIRKLRKALTCQPEQLGTLAKILYDQNGMRPRRDTLALLDLCTRAKGDGEEQALLPLRGHIFHRTQSGLWACCNPACAGRKNSPLDNLTWPFGAVLMERHEYCPHCGTLVFELVVCSECGAEYLAAEQHFDEETSKYSLQARRFDRDQDEFQLEFEQLDLEEQEADEQEDTQLRSQGLPRLIGRSCQEAEPIAIHPRNGEFPSAAENIHLHVLRPDPGHQNCRCPVCGRNEKFPQELFRPARLGAPFLLSVAIPTLLESSPPGEGEIRQGPWQGRRLLTFSDSRQGTARFALKSQLDAERNHIRSWLYHKLATARPHVDVQKITELRKEIEALTPVATSLVLKKVLEDKQRELAEQENISPLGVVSWTDTLSQLPHDNDFRSWIKYYWRNTTFEQLSEAEIPRLLLFQEFLRRPRRLNSLETLGLISLHYPRLQRITALPSICQQRGISIVEWGNLLKIIVDFYIRANAAVDIPGSFLRWLGGSTRRNTFILGPNAQVTNSGRQRRWPQYGRQSRKPYVVTLLAVALRLNLAEKQEISDLNEILYSAWEAIRPMLLQNDAGEYLLKLEQETELSEIRSAWLCPVTHKVLDTVFREFTPYVPQKHDDPEQLKCRPITMPRLPYPFWTQADGAKITEQEIQTWLETDPEILNARKHAVWPELSDRIASGVPYFRVVEHSAQQSGKKLQGYEDKFKQGLVNVLSCSTTMEMGVDIGGLSVVAMNNAPPGPANFLQRAGRAGRRQEATAASLTLCKSTPHNEAVFHNPLWPFRTPIHVPQVSLQSARIVKRHLNALILADFLSSFGQNIPGLTAEWFYEPPTAETVAPAQQFEEWCRDPARLQEERLLQGLTMLLGRTCLAGMPAQRILENSAEHSETLRERWEQERDALLRDLKTFGRRRPQEPATPAELAIERQLRRLREEYLLRELAAKGFLPGYGFPNDVVPFIPTTLEELRHRQRRKEQRQRKNQTREDNTRTFRDYPSRELMTALREYAPGAEIVLDGRVYKSEGVTLNWHMPPSEQAIHEIQALRQAWRCSNCGATGTSSRLAQSCEVCQSSRIRNHEYLQPAGFAVSIGYKPDNDLSKNAYIPVQTPWITADSEWLGFPVPGLGRYRYSSQGHIFHWNAGLHNHGFAVCLRCGKADSETEERPRNEGEPYPMLPASLHEHFRLRGGREADGESRCSGNDDTWAIKRHLWLGTASHTDVFELQMLDAGDGKPLDDKTAAYSLAVALRQALAEKLGVDEREIGCDAVRTTTDNDSPVRSVILYDTAGGGAGYVASAMAELKNLCERAQDILACTYRCDKACHHCLLGFDTQHQIDHLDRRSAQKLLTERFFTGLQLPAEQRIFGDATRAEFEPLRIALGRELQGTDIREIRLYLSGAQADWALPEWLLRDDILRWRSEKYTVTLVLEELPQDADLSNALAAFAEFGCRLVRDQCAVGTGYLLAETGGTHHHTRWAAFDESAGLPGAAWGRGMDKDQYCVRYTAKHPLPELSGTSFSAKDLRRSYGGNIHELKITSELDGPVAEFGTRFWEAVFAVRPDMKTRWSANGPLQEIRYTDRYLKSPLTVKLLGQVIFALEDVDKLIAPETYLTLRTAEIIRARATATKIEHDWQQDRHRNQIAELFFQQNFSGHVDIDSRHYRQLPHVRELRLIWQQGREWLLRLDQGMGYWITDRTTYFDFSNSLSNQAESLRQLNFGVQAGYLQFPTVLYLDNE